MPGHEALKYVMKSMDSLQSDLRRMVNHESPQFDSLDLPDGSLQSQAGKDTFAEGVAKATSLLKGIEAKPEGSEIDEFEDKSDKLMKESLMLPDKLKPQNPDALFLHNLMKETKLMIRKLKLL